MIGDSTAEKIKKEIGRQVTVYGGGVYTAITGDITMGNLPYTNGNSRAGTVNALLPVGITSTDTGLVEQNATTFNITVNGTYSGGGISFYFSLTYFT